MPHYEDIEWKGMEFPREKFDELQAFDGKYWMTYIGGAKQGYETDPLSIGVAWTDSPTEAKAWTRFPGNPVLTPRQADVREALAHERGQRIGDGRWVNL